MGASSPENFEKLFTNQCRNKMVINPARIQNGSPNKMDAASHFHMKKYNCLTVTSAKAFGFGSGAGSGTGPTISGG